MNEQEKIEILRTLRVIAINASDEIRREVLGIVKNLVDTYSVGWYAEVSDVNDVRLNLSVYLLEYPLAEDYYESGVLKPNKIRAIKALRDAGVKIGRPLNLRDAKELVEKYPCDVFTNLSAYLAELASSVLTNAGCKAEIRG